MKLKKGFLLPTFPKKIFFGQTLRQKLDLHSSKTSNLLCLYVLKFRTEKKNVRKNKKIKKSRGKPSRRFPWPPLALKELIYRVSVESWRHFRFCGLNWFYLVERPAKRNVSNGKMISQCKMSFQWASYASFSDLRNILFYVKNDRIRTNLSRLNPSQLRSLSLLYPTTTIE